MAQFLCTHPLACDDLDDVAIKVNYFNRFGVCLNANHRHVPTMWHG
jgi:hypothetical protein